jgi:peptidoglycan/xylan/chitin deacetylase (PgdA/CDA1 family)
VSAAVVLHSFGGPPGTELARNLAAPGESFGPLRPLVGPFQPPVVRLSGADDVVADAAASLPAGAARAEAVAVRLRRAGADVRWGEPIVFPDLRSVARCCYDRGASSVEVLRSDPSLLTEMQAGAFFHAYWRRRAVRRLACHAAPASARVRLPAALALDSSFWSGVRSAATAREWRRLTRCSYVVFYVHRLSGDPEPGQEHLDVSPRRLARQLRVLRLLGFRPLSADELLEFHADGEAVLDGRRYVLAADDGFRDAVGTLRRRISLHPHVFVCTSCVGGAATWGADEPLATWDELREFRAAGGIVASHSRAHVPLPDLAPEALEGTLRGSLQDLGECVPPVVPLLAYPHGQHDEHVRRAAIGVGYQAAFTTEPGRNGAGVDTHCLRRIELKQWDGTAAVTWKALTGELLPWAWERRRRWRRR